MCSTLGRTRNFVPDRIIRNFSHEVKFSPNLDLGNTLKYREIYPYKNIRL